MGDCFTYLMYKSESLPASILGVAYKTQLVRPDDFAFCVKDVSSLSPSLELFVGFEQQAGERKLLVRVPIGLRVCHFPSNIVWLKKCDL